MKISVQNPKSPTTFLNNLSLAKHHRKNPPPLQGTPTVAKGERNKQLGADFGLVPCSLVWLSRRDKQRLKKSRVWGSYVVREKEGAVP